MTLELHATPSEVMRAVDALRQMARAVSAPESTIFHLSLALEELASNVVNHACGGDPTRTFRVILSPAIKQFWVELRDAGPPFDPTQPEQPADRDGRPSGGWGLPIARQRLDAIEYRRESGENVLRFAKLWE